MIDKRIIIAKLQVVEQKLNYLSGDRFLIKGLKDSLKQTEEDIGGLNE